MTTRKPSQRYFRALALEPRILLDAAAINTAADVAAQVDATAEAPGVKATPQNSVITITDSTDSFAPVDLFKNVDVTLAADNEELSGLVISIEGTGANQALRIDGETIVLVNGASGMTDATGYAYSISVNGSVTTVSLDFASTRDVPTSESIETLISGLQYQVQSTSVASGSLSITLESLSDQGDSRDLDIRATITLDNQINVAPQIISDGSLDPRETFRPEDLGIGTGAEVVYSADGKYAYVAGTGAVTAFSVDASGHLTQLETLTIAGMNTATEMVISADGRSIYLIDTLGPNQQSYQADYIHVIGVDNGELSLVATVNSGNGGTTGGMALSDDGAYLYVGTASNDVAIFSRNASSGELTFLARAAGESGSNSRHGSIAVSGNNVYVMYSSSAHVLISYSRNSDGTLEKLASLNTSASGFGAVAYSMMVSKDGQYLYVAHPGNGTIITYAVGGSEITQVESQTLSGVSSIALSDDGRMLYASTAQGAINIYSIAGNGGLTQLGSIATGSAISDIAVAGDGVSLLVSGSGEVTRFSSVQTLNIDQATPFASGLTLKDGNYDALAGGAGNYSGGSFSVSANATGGSFGFASGNDLVLSGNSITQGNTTIASFTVDTDGKLTVSFSADTSSAVANQILQQITYTSAAGTLAGSVVSLTLQGRDGTLTSNEAVIQLRANNAPQVNNGASGELGTATTETPYTFVLPADLFTDANGDTLTWSLEGLPAGFSFDPFTRTLSGTAAQPGDFTLTVKVTDIYGASTTREVTLEVAQIDNRAPQVAAAAPATLPSVVVGTADYQNALANLFTDPDKAYADSTLTWNSTTLPQGLSLDSATGLLSGTPSTLGDYSITVTVTDEHGATASHTLALRVITAGEAANSAPTLEAGGSDLIYSNDGALSGYNNYVYSLTLSDDGKTLAVVGGSSPAATGTTTSNNVLSLYSRDTETGKLTLVQTFVQGATNDGNASNGIEINGLVGAMSVTYSNDGKYLYVAGRISTSSPAIITVLSVNADGTLSSTGLSAATAAADTLHQIVVNDAGTALYAVANGNLYAYAIGNDGGLTALGGNTAEAGRYSNNFSASNIGQLIDIDAEGTVYILSDSKVTIYRANSDSSLTYAGQLTRSGTALSYTDSNGAISVIGTLPSSSGLASARMMVVSDTGHLYIVTGTNNYLTVLGYDDTTNSMSLVSSQNVNTGQLGTNPWGLALSNDGSTLYVGGGGGGKVALYDVNTDGSVNYVRTIDIATRAGRIVVSADGDSIYSGGTYQATGLSQLSANDAVALPYTEGQSINPAAGLTLSDVDYDALNGAAGNYNGATITLQRDGAVNADDRFALSAGNGLTLVGQEIRLDGVKIADFTEAGGKLTLAFSADVSTATANAVLKQIAYSNDAQEPEASIRLKLEVQDQYQSGVSSFALVLNVARVNDAPEVTATPAANLSHDAGYTAPVALFSDAQISVVEQGQLITGLTFSVSGLKDGAAETLQLDGSSIALVAGSGTTTNGYAWTVTVDATSSVATVALSSPTGLSEAAASALITGLSYANSDKNNGTSGERIVTLSSVKDNGGTANGGQDTATLNISATVTVRGDLSPTLGADIGSVDLAELITSSDYPNPYDGLNGVVQVGNLVYAVRTASVWDSNTSSDVPTSTLYVFQRGQDGTLSLLTTIEANTQNGLLSASGLGLSADGSTLYATTDNGIALFDRDTSSGELTARGLIATDLALINDVQINGNVAYLSTADGVTLFHRSADSWSTGVTLSAPGDSTFTDLQLSSDNRYLYAATTGGNTLLSVFQVNPDGSLGSPVAIAGDQSEHFADRLALSADGTALYVIDGNNLYTMSVGANGVPQIVGDALALEGPTKQLLISDDGSLLIVVGEAQITLYGRAADGSLTERAQTSGVGETNQWGEQALPFGELRGAALSTDGTQLYLSGTFNWDHGLLVLDLKPAAPTFTENAEAVALLPGGTLADPQLDALANGAGNYNGASIVVSRDGNANPDDVFGLIASQGLELRDNAIWLDGISIASVVNSAGSMTITFTGNVSRADAQRVLRSIAYSNASNDPTADGKKATVSITLNDGEGHDDKQLVDVALVGVNDPAIVNTTVLSPTFTAEGERVKLFENTRIDTVEVGQAIWYVAVTIDNVRPGDVLGVGNGRIALDGNSGTGTTGTGQQYNILPPNADGSTTAWIYTTLLPINEVEALVDSITYGHTGADSSGQRSITLAVEEFISNAGANDVTTTTLATRAVVTIEAAATVNTPPTLGTLPANSAYTEQAEPIQLAPNASVADAQLDRFNNNLGNYNGATLTLTLGEGKSAADTLGFKADNGLSIVGNNLQKDGTTIGQVSVADGVMTITFSDDQGVTPTTADVQNTLRQITYANSSDAPAASVEVSIKLADQRGLASAEQSLTIEITPINDAPAINDNPILSLGDLENLQNLSGIPGLGTPTHSAVSADGIHVYVADGQGNIAHFSRDSVTGELSHVATLAGQMNLVQIQAAPDGSGLYVLHNDGGSSVITRFAADADGSLQRQESIAGPSTPVAMSLSNDGRNLYVIDSYMSAITAYSRDSATGSLTLLATIDGDSSTSPYLWSPQEVVARADQVFVITSSSLIVYQRDANGALTPLASIRSGATDASGKAVNLSNVQHIAVSADGRTIFVANSWTTRTEGGGWTNEPIRTVVDNHPQTIDAFSLDPATRALTHLGTISDIPTVEDIALSDDGKALLVTRNDGSLAYYSAIALEKMDSSQTGLTGANRISLSADGAVIVTGNSLYVLNVSAIPSPSTVIGGDAVALFPALTLNDAELDAANNYQGASVTIGGQPGDRFGLLDNATYSLDGQRILRGGSEVATLVQTGNTAVLRFTAAISQSDATALLRQISYASDTGAVGNHSINLTLNDGEINSQARSVEVTLLAPNQAPVVSDAHGDYALNDAKAGQAYSIALPANLFTDPEGDSLTWTVTGLPTGLSFNPTTHVISGTTTVMGEHTVVVTARDPSGGTVSLELTLNVSNSAPVAGSDYSLDRTAPGESYSVTLPENLFTDANDSDLTWEIVELPEWLSYDAATRTLSGTAPDVAGSHSITITATDPHGATVSRTLTLAVALPPVQDTGEAALPELNTGFPQQPNTAPTASFGGQALNAPLFESSDAAANTPAEAHTAAQPAPTVQSLLRSSGNGLADGRGSLSQQLANAAGVLTDSGYQNTAGSFSFDGARFTTSVDLNASSERSVSLTLPVELPNGGTAQRITLANGLPLPSWASFDARSGELRIDRERLKGDGVLRLTLISRDGEGREQRTPMEIRAEGASPQKAVEALQQPAPVAELLPERMRQDTSSALLSDALELLDQLSDLAGEPVAVTTRHIA